MNIWEIAVTGIDGRAHAMSAYGGQVLLIVNVASQCGFTPQYSGLEALHREFHDRGFSVLGFPCDQFGHQEPGTEAEIHRFCVDQYDITFPLFSKVDVNGPRTHPLFEFLKNARPGVLGTESIKWNFTKFLVGKGGAVVKRYGSMDAPDALRKDIEALLK